MLSIISKVSLSKAGGKPRCWLNVTFLNEEHTKKVSFVIAGQKETSVLGVILNCVSNCPDAQRDCIIWRLCLACVSSQQVPTEKHPVLASLIMGNST